MTKKKIELNDKNFYTIFMTDEFTDENYTDTIEFGLKKIGISPTRVGMKIGQYMKTNEDMAEMESICFNYFRAGVLLSNLYPDIFKVEKYKSLGDYNKYLKKNKKEVDKKETMGLG